MKPMPVFQKLVLNIEDVQSWPGTGAIAFEANNAPDSPPARHITVEAGRCGTWVLTFTSHETIPANGAICFKKLERNLHFDWRHQDYWPESMGYVTLEDEQGQALEFDCDTSLAGEVPAMLYLNEPFPAGKTIVLRIGDQRAGGDGIYVQPAAFDRLQVAMAVILPGELFCRRVHDATVSAQIVPCPPARRTFCFAPSTVRARTPFRFSLIRTDLNNNPIPFEDPPHLHGAGLIDATARSTPQGSAAGQACLAVDAGVTHIEVRAANQAFQARSNPIRVVDNGMQLYWGEFRAHGYDGVEIDETQAANQPKALFRYARETTRLDFLALSLRLFRKHADSVEACWPRYLEAARTCYDPGRFLTFVGCSWYDQADAGGTRNIVWQSLDAEQPDPAWTIADLHQLAPQKTLITPLADEAPAIPEHHHAGLERLCEISSGCGNAEWLIQAYLQKGHKLGMIGGSGCTNAMPGNPRGVSMCGGQFYNLLRRADAGWGNGPLLAVYADSLDRDALWEAFRLRRVYASTGARALLDFKVNGALMGAEIEADQPVHIEVSVEGTAAIERITLVRGDRQLKTWAPACESVNLHLDDTPPKGTTWYYVRIEQVDGETLWSSPVWVQSACQGSNEGLLAWNEPVALNLEQADNQEAAQYLPDVLRYLEKEEHPTTFTDLTPVAMQNGVMGRYAVFLGYTRNQRIRIHWFPEFELPRIRLEMGWSTYGRERIDTQRWVCPQFPFQDTR